MLDPKKFTTPTAKPLPVVLLLDVSKSMSGSKIDNLNKAVENMLDSFSQGLDLNILSNYTIGDCLKSTNRDCSGVSVFILPLEDTIRKPDGERITSG